MCLHIYLRTTPVMPGGPQNLQTPTLAHLGRPRMLGGIGGVGQGLVGLALGTRRCVADVLGEELALALLRGLGGVDNHRHELVRGHLAVARDAQPLGEAHQRRPVGLRRKGLRRCGREPADQLVDRLVGCRCLSVLRVFFLESIFID